MADELTRGETVVPPVPVPPVPPVPVPPVPFPPPVEPPPCDGRPLLEGRLVPGLVGSLVDFGANRDEVGRDEVGRGERESGLSLERVLAEGLAVEDFDADGVADADLLAEAETLGVGEPMGPPDTVDGALGGGSASPGRWSPQPVRAKAVTVLTESSHFRGVRDGDITMPSHGRKSTIGNKPPAD